MRILSALPRVPFGNGCGNPGRRHGGGRRGSRAPRGGALRKPGMGRCRPTGPFAGARLLRTGRGQTPKNLGRGQSEGWGRKSLRRRPPRPPPDFSPPGVDARFGQAASASSGRAPTGHPHIRRRRLGPGLKLRMGSSCRQYRPEVRSGGTFFFKKLARDLKALHDGLGQIFFSKDRQQIDAVEIPVEGRRGRDLRPELEIGLQ